MDIFVFAGIYTIILATCIPLYGGIISVYRSLMSGTWVAYSHPPTCSVSSYPRISLGHVLRCVLGSNICIF